MAVNGLSTIVGKRGNIITRCDSNGIHDTNYYNTIKSIAVRIEISADKVQPWMYFGEAARRQTASIKQRGVHCRWYDYKIMQEDKHDRCSYYNRSSRRPR